MKKEAFLGAWIVVLLICTFGIFLRLLPWPASLRGLWSAGDWAAWVQAVGSVAAIAAGAFAIRWQVAQDAKRETMRDMRNSLQEVVEVLELVEAAYVRAVADRDSCGSDAALLARASDKYANAEGDALHDAFREAHLDHIRSIRVRMAFVRARRAYKVVFDLTTRLVENVRGRVGFDRNDYRPLLQEQIDLMIIAIQQLTDSASDLRSRIDSESA